MKNLIEFKNVSYSYMGQEKETLALKNINLDIKEGEFICLLGPSGCGKSTMLNILAGYIFPTEGEVLDNGQVIDAPSEKRGVVFQSPTLYPWYNVRQNVEFGPTLAGMSKEEKNKISSKLLKSVGLSDFAQSKTFELSGGMKQRASLARVLANDPEVILMDEPFGALDALTKLKMQKLIRNIWHNDNRTVFMITHDIDEALSLATKIIVMSSLPGQIDKIIETDYTYAALKDKKHRVHIDDKYIKLKEDILDLIE